VAERYAAIESLIEQQPDAIHPVTREITLGARGRTAVQAFQAQYRLKALKQQADTLLASVSFCMTPTAGTIYRIDAMLADPIRLNSNLGYYTNFMNLLDLAAIASPAGFRPDGMPFGVTLFAARDTEEALLRWADRLHRATTNNAGAQRISLPAPQWPTLLPGFIPIAVCGAHMNGLPLNHQLTSRNAYLLEATTTATAYRLYALPGGPPYRPGLIRVGEGGVAIDLEVWALPASQWGEFMAGIPAPLGLGHVMLADGRTVAGFLCENHALLESKALSAATDISAHRGWRQYMKSQS